MGNRDVATGFVQAFCAGDMAGVEAVLDPDFELHGPLFSFNSKADYVAALHTNPPEPGACEIISVLEGAGTIAVFYTHHRASGPVTVAQLFWFSAGSIARTLLVFDSAAVA